jgi:hypothetical protein
LLPGGKIFNEFELATTNIGVDMIYNVRTDIKNNKIIGLNITRYILDK